MDGIPLDEFNILYTEVIEDSEEELTIISSDLSQLKKRSQSYSSSNPSQVSLATKCGSNKRLRSGKKHQQEEVITISQSEEESSGVSEESSEDSEEEDDIQEEPNNDNDNDKDSLHAEKDSEKSNSNSVVIKKKTDHSQPKPTSPPEEELVDLETSTQTIKPPKPIPKETKIRPLANLKFKVQKKGNLDDILNKMGNTNVRVGLNKNFKIESLHKRRKV